MSVRHGKLSLVRFLWLLPLLVWIVVILHLSSQTYQQQTIIPWLARIIDPATLSEKLPDVHFRYGDKYVQSKLQPYQFIEFVFRKTAHFIVYFTLSFLAMLALHPFNRRKRWKAVLVIILCLILSVLDETIQSVTDSRTPLPEDVAVDLSGAAVGLWLAALLLRPKRKRCIG